MPMKRMEVLCSMEFRHGSALRQNWSLTKHSGPNQCHSTNKRRRESMTKTIGWLSCVVATVASYALCMGISSAVAADSPCSRIVIDCPGWGTEDPRVQGYCCVASGGAQGVKKCGVGIQGANAHPSAYCGVLVQIVNQQCSGASGEGCGSPRAASGCVTSNCPG